LKYLIPICLLILACTPQQKEIAQWRGPERNGIYPETRLSQEWPTDGPELVLKIEGIGKGHSQPIVSENKIFITGINTGAKDYLSAYDLDGNLMWKSAYGEAWDKTYPESRGTPTIEDDRVYLIGGQGKLVCLDANNGDIIWQQDPMKDFKGSRMWFGFAESVLLNDQYALYLTGGKETTVVAYDKITGELGWKSEPAGGQKPYASALLIERGELQIALFQTSEGPVGINASNGDVLWKYNTAQFHDEKGMGEAANTPLYHEGDFFVTYGNGQPGTLFSLSDDGRSISLKWKNPDLDTHHGGLVLFDGVIYGSTMIDNSSGNWAAVDWETGETMWEEEWHTKGSIVSADGMLYCYEEKRGHVALVQPDRNKMNIISTFRITDGSGPHWAHPAIYDGKLYMRHGDVVIVYELRD